jgi:LacI family transcriptional regulator
VLISVINNRAKDFKNVKELFNSKAIFAGIFIGGRNYEPEITNIVERGFKVAVVEQEIKDGDDIFNNSLVINGDSLNGAYNAVNYLISLGHRDIAHITGDLKQYSGMLRLEGYKKALRDNGIEIETSLILKGDYSDESGYKAAKKFFSKKKATAIFVGNDTMALGVMRAAREMGVKIPADVSIIGYDDIDIASYLVPPLTTVRQSFFEMAQIATDNLIRANEDGTSFYGKYTVPVELIERGSCRKVDA